MPDSKPPSTEHRSERERFLAVLNDITYAALEVQNFEELLQLLADRLAEIINADGCFLTLWDEATRSTIPGAAYGPLRDSYRKYAVKPNEPTLTRTVIDSDKTLIVKDAWDSDFALSHVSRQFPSRGLLAIPIKAGGRNLGAAIIAFERVHDFPPIEIEYCEQAVRQISLAIANGLTMDALKQSEQNQREIAEALLKREEHLDAAQAIAKMGSWERKAHQEIAVWSAGLFKLFGLEPQSSPPPQEVIYKLIVESDRQKLMDFLGQPVVTESTSRLEFRTIAGKYLTATLIRDNITGRFAGTVQDITEQRLLEAELFQARKMEAVGTLAGGIAHNFNNILTVIMGNYELLRCSIAEGSAESKTLNQCSEATERAAQLTRQLLVVSQNHELTPVPLDINVLITDMVELLAPLVGEHISVSTNFCSQSSVVNVDVGHLEQVVMNLVLNARDAIQDGGTLNIFTELRDIENTIVITVEDNGPGIPEADLPHIFDPFFTTKEVGKGTGLGLATVQSIIQQSHGDIEVDSEQGRGTRISIVLPMISNTASRPSRLPDALTQPTIVTSPFVATILLVEDLESLRNLAQLALEKAGHQVISAERGDDALELAKSGISFDLILSDVQLPGLSGPDLAGEIFKLRERTPVIFMSGLREPVADGPDVYFIPKPFRGKELLALINQAMNIQ